MPGKPLIQVITINWNNARQTGALLDSLRAAQPIEAELRILVVDNGSRDGSPETLARCYPEADILRSPQNIGYAAAANLGIRRAVEEGADYCWLLNNDTIVAPQTIPALLRAATGLEAPAILSPIIYYHAEPERIWFAGGRMDARMKTTHIGQGEIDQRQYAGLREVDWVSGCAPFFSRAVVERAGFWPVQYFLYLEDVDWCLAARESGIRCYVVGDAPLRHDVSTSMNTLDPAIGRYYAWRNYYLLGRRRGRGLARLRVELDLWWCLAKSGLRWLCFPAYRSDHYYHARTHGLIDLLFGRVGVGAWPMGLFDGR